MSKITEFLNVDEATKALTGRKPGLRPSKPSGKGSENGLMQWVWRMARFHAGHDTTMPMMCDFDLQNWLDAKFGPKVVNILYCTSGTEADLAKKEILKELDEFVDKVLVAMGEDRFAAARRYKGLLY